MQSIRGIFLRQSRHHKYQHQSALLKTSLNLCLVALIFAILAIPHSLAQPVESNNNKETTQQQSATVTSSGLTLNTNRQSARSFGPRPKLFGNNNNRRELKNVTANNDQLARLRNANEFVVEDELPADFHELPPEQLDLGANATGRAPNPILNVAVLQNGNRIDSAVNVHPGTPLEMIIYLDDKSAKVYGLLASSLKVQDNTLKQREETIIQNGCSIDTYIFGNFELNQEDKSLRAKFRAFKFPDSNFVRFVGTVNVCIKECPNPDCETGINSNGSLARRKRSAKKTSGLVLTVSTLLRIGNPPSSSVTLSGQ